MAKPKTRYVCQACGSVTARWQGQCTDCAEWNTLVQEAAEVSSIFAAKHNLQGGGRQIQLVSLDHPVALPERIATGIAEFDRAIGGGIVPGSAMLVGGDPGIGKSTLLLQVCADLASKGRNVIYVSGEESAEQVRRRADRLSTPLERLLFLGETNVDAVLKQLEDVRPVLAIIDSIQTLYTDDNRQWEAASAPTSSPGTAAQVRECTRRLLQWAKGRAP